MARPITYKINDRYFEKINTSNKAYVLGFMYADGSVNDRAFSATISSKDVEILNFICNELKTERPLSYKMEGKYACLGISSVKMSADLIKQGIIKNKTYLSKKFPVETNHAYFNDFLRGFFDGDGGIGVANRKKTGKEYYVCFSGNYYVLSQLKKYLLKNDISSSKVRHRYGKENKISCMLELKGRRNIEKIYALMYRKKSFSLSRKKQKFLDFIEHNKTIRKNYDKGCELFKKVKSLYIKNIKPMKISNMLGISYDSARHIVERLQRLGEIKRNHIYIINNG